MCGFKIEDSGHTWQVDIFGQTEVRLTQTEVRLFLRLGLGSWAETARRAAALLRVCVGWGGAVSVWRLAGWMLCRLAGWSFE